MTLTLRLTLLLGFLLALFLGGVALLNSTHNAETARVATAAQQEHSRLLDEILSLVEYPIDQFTRDYSLWDEMVAFVEKPTDEWARVNIRASVETFRLHAVWVLRADGALVHAAGAPDADVPPVMPVSANTIRAISAKQPFKRFFAYVGPELCEVRAGPIQPSNDINRTGAPRGWLIAARRLDASRLETLGKLTGATVTIGGPDAGANSVRSDGFEIIRPLPGADGNPLASLKLSYSPPGFESTEIFNRDETLIFILQGILLITITATCIHFWVLSPTRRIIASLRADDPALVAPLARKPDETGLIARLVQSNFADRQALQRNERALAHTLAERIRLGRDLHDNVIQSLFATGMGLAATRGFVRTSPEQVEEGLEQVRSCLNEIIRDVRTFIVGLEPDSLEDKTFSQAVASLADALRSIRSCVIETDIDDSAADSLPPYLRQHALQLVREALLNSFRHTGATRLQLSLQDSTDHVNLSLTDDGISSSPVEKTPAGLGLASIAERAALVGAACEIAALPGRGNRIRIRYSRTVPTVV